MKRFDPSLYLVVGPDDCPGGRMGAVVDAAVAGGVTMVQLRDKADDRDTRIERAKALMSRLRPLAVPLIVNDDPEAAAAAGADGVHVGPFDRPAAEARQIVGPDAILGLSVTALAEAADVNPDLVDYVGLGPVFPTPTKPDAAAPIGLEGLRAGCRALSVPVVAIGGIQAGNAGDVIRAGADGIAVVSAICSAVDPRSAVQRLALLVQQARANASEALT